MPSPKLERSSLPIIAIVGRANVGKSSLWNRLIEEKRALISAHPHTTRDRNTAEALWRGERLLVVDTGGYDTENDEIGQGIRRQAERAVNEADVVFFLVDARTGVLPEDRTFAKFLRSAKDRVIILVNKVDSPRDLARAAESRAEALGFGEAMNVSAATGSGVGDALDEAFEMLRRRASGVAASDRTDVKRQDVTAPDAGNPLRLVLIGRPNVGKSSLVNAILGEERVIASAIAHTTREPQDTNLAYLGRPIVLVDTAGMRRRANISGRLEEEAMRRNRTALERADIGILVLDASDAVSAQDKLLAGMIVEAGKGLIIVVNKWDAVPNKTTRSAKDAEALVRKGLPFAVWAPVLFTSAKTGRRADDVLEAALRAADERKREIAYNAINRLLKSVIRARRPLQRLGPKSPYVYDIAQTGTEPPTFLITVRGQKISLAPAWMKFLERRIREQFGFEGTPIVVKAAIVPMAKSEKAHNVRGPGMDESDAAASPASKGTPRKWAKRKVRSSHRAPGPTRR